jgi:hypothetical protein
MKASTTSSNLRISTSYDREGLFSKKNDLLDPSMESFCLGEQKPISRMRSLSHSSSPTTPTHSQALFADNIHEKNAVSGLSSLESRPNAHRTTAVLVYGGLSHRKKRLEKSVDDHLLQRDARIKKHADSCSPVSECKFQNRNTYRF